MTKAQTTENVSYLDFAFTTQPNTLKGWGMGALVSQAQDMFYCGNKVDKRCIK